MYDFVKRVKSVPAKIFKDKQPTEAEQLDAVKINGLAIQYIDNPSAKVQLAAVKQNGRLIRLFKNATEEMKLAAVKQNGCSILYIKNPSEEIKLAAVKTTPDSIMFIRDLTEEIQLAAVKQRGFAIQYIKNPSEAVQMAAVEKNPCFIRFIASPSETLQLLAVRKYGMVIVHINKPTEKVKKFVQTKYKRINEFREQYKQNRLTVSYYSCFIFTIVDSHYKPPYGQCFIEFSGEGIKNINDISEEKQLKVVRNGYFIHYIKNPTEIVKLHAVQSEEYWHYALNHIKTLTSEFQLAILQHNTQSFHEFIKKPCYKLCIVYYLYQFDIDYPIETFKVTSDIKEEIGKMDLRRFDIETYQGQHDFLKAFPEHFDCIMDVHNSIKLEMIEKDPANISKIRVLDTNVVLGFVNKIR